ncbi:MAG: tetratricopeptide repeat protein [Acidobacteriota bacterium]
MTTKVRRHSLRLVLIPTLAALLVACGTDPADDVAASSEIAKKQRSVLLVTLDTTRPDRLEPYGAENVETPVMRRLASRGILFERAWAVAPITLVSHTSILSGLYPFEHGVRNNGMQYVPETVTTLAERLLDEGYRTSAFVSAAVLEKRYGLDQGFEVYDDDLSDRRNLSARMVADRTAESTVASATAWLDGLGDGERFFSWVHFYDPHANYSPPPPFRDTYRDRLYDGEVAYMDYQLGQLLTHPRLSSASEDAPIIIVIADHGESLGDHGERTHAILAYDSTLHVPFIMHVPGGPAGLRIGEPVGHVDVMPTVLSLLGLPIGDDGISGRDLTPVIERRSREPNRDYYSETYLPYYTYGWAKLKVLHRGRWKIIDAPQPELYDRIRDPKELTDLHDQQTDIAYDMKRDLDEWLSGYDSEGEASLELDSEAVAQLRSLGYLSVGSGQRKTDGVRPNPMEMIGQHVGLERSRMFLADRLYSQAQAQLESVLRRDPQNLAAMIDLVRAYEGLEKIDEGIEVAERALALDPAYTQTTMMLARLESQRGDLTRALELADVAVTQDPINPDIRIQRAGFLQRLGRIEETEEVLAEALRAHPEHPRVNAFYANIVEARKGDLQAAEERLVKVLERDPFLDQGWLFLGRVQERSRQPEAAIESYRRGLRSRPDAGDLHGALGHLLARLGRHNEAINQLQEAIRLSVAERTELHVSLGSVLAELGRFDEANRQFEKVLAMNPSHPGARNNAAIALYRSGRVDEARAALQAVVEEFPRLADAHNNLAAIAVDTQQWRDAIRHAERTLELAPNLVEAWNNLAIGQEETRQFAAAEKTYRKAIELEPDYWPAQFNLGLLFKKTEQAQKAADIFNEVLLRVPNHPETHLELGELYAGPLTDPGRARIHWNALLRHAPTHPRGAEIRSRLSAL